MHGIAPGRVAVARLREHGLRRSVGMSGLFATAYGNVGSSIYYALGLVAAHALGLTPLVFMFAGGLFVLTAKTYAEGAAMFPEAGGASSFARHAFNEVVSFFAGWALTLDYIITIAISAFFVPHYLAVFFPVLGHNPGDIIGGAGVIAVLAALNIRGLGESANLNVLLALLSLATQAALVGLGLVLVLNPSLLVHQVHLGVAPSWTQLIFALSVAMVAYTGIETVSNMAEEAHDPGRDVPRALKLVVLAVLGVYAGISVVALSALPVVRDHAGHFSTLLGTTYENNPVLGIVSRLRLHGVVLTVATDYVGVLAAAILLIATNAGLIGISRLSWSLAEHRQLPGLFSSLHPRFRTPWFTILFFSVLAALLLLPGQTNLLGNLYAFGAMLSFTTAHVAIVALRVKQRDVHRPYKIRGNVRWRGADIPISAVFGGLGTLAAWVSVVALHNGGAPDRSTMDGGRAGGVLLLPQAPRPRPEDPVSGRAGGASARFHRAWISNGARSALRRRRQREDAHERGEARGRRRHRLCGPCVARAPSTPARRGPRGRGGVGPLDPRGRPDPRPSRRHQGADRPDPCTQPGRRACRRGSAHRRRCDLPL